MGGVPVVGQQPEFHEPWLLTDAVLQRLGCSGVGSGSFSREQVVVDRLAHEPVSEVHMLTDDAQHVAVERLAQTGIERIVIDPCDACQEAGIDPTAVHRGQPQQIASRTGQRIDAGEKKIVQRPGQSPLAGLQQLLGVQRIALRPRQQ